LVIPGRNEEGAVIPFCIQLKDVADKKAPGELTIDF
jgi:hypothetical protein